MLPTKHFLTEKRFYGKTSFQNGSSFWPFSQKIGKHFLKPKNKIFVQSRLEAKLRYHDMYSSAFAGDRTKLRLFENFARSDALYEDYGADQILLGLIHEPMQNMDTIVTKALTDHLFEDRTRKFSGQDLVAINIMRGRDHGVPGYNEFREYCNLTRAADFSDLSTYMPPETAAAIQKVYRHVDDIDLYLGGIAEYSVYGGVVSTEWCICARLFCRWWPTSLSDAAIISSRRFSQWDYWSNIWRNLLDYRGELKKLPCIFRSVRHLPVWSQNKWLELVAVTDFGTKPTIRC